ncbi:methyltransferase-like protein 25B isoform X2 [Acipenser ruthenus]|uniref:methyltransferase-like protein 25B isoform X2 n=1 Tax=Acipenser ruthenus TaxID=7906 RepID=UPI002741CBD8|nr:methyltransferase-like protein 25B isoform X2 [Acipenser ruthenus]
MANPGIVFGSLRLSVEQQKHMAAKLCCFLSTYRHIIDSHIIEFFSDSLWETLPPGWQEALCELSGPQLADLLLDSAPGGGRSYPSVWPLSLLAFKAAARALAFPRMPRGGAAQETGSGKSKEFWENSCRSSTLKHVFRKHVKPKKQHEVRKLGALVKRMCDLTSCQNVVDVGSGQGHLTRFLSLGLGLSVTGVEANPALVSMATKLDRELRSVALKERARAGAKTGVAPDGPCDPLPRHVAGWVNPGASWEEFVTLLQQPMGISDSRDGPPESHGTNSQEGFVLTGLHACGDLSATLLRHFARCPQAVAITSVACCYMKLTTLSNPAPPGLQAPPLPRPGGGDCAEGAGPVFGYPMSSWVQGLPGHELSCKAREAACHALESYAERLRGERGELQSHCYRAVLETLVRRAQPSLKRAGIQTIKKAHLLSFAEYARLGLQRLELPTDWPLDWVPSLEALLAQQGRVVAYFCLVLLLAPAVESLVLLDRMLYLSQEGLDCELLPLFSLSLSLGLDCELLPLFTLSLGLDCELLPLFTHSFPLSLGLDCELLPLFTHSLSLSLGLDCELLPLFTHSLPLSLVLDCELLPLFSLSLSLGLDCELLPLFTLPLSLGLDCKLLPLFTLSL